MSDERKYTERDLVLAKREAYVQRCLETGQAVNRRAYERWAEELYPLPKVTRPRVVTGGDGKQYRNIDGEIQVKYPGDIWVSSAWNSKPLKQRTAYDTKDLLAIANVIARPTEEVPHD